MTDLPLKKWPLHAGDPDRLAGYSKSGIRIHSIYRLLSDLKKITQKDLVEQSQKWWEACILDKERFRPIKSKVELSKAKKRDPDISAERVKEIEACLEEMLRLLGYKIEEYPDPTSGHAKIAYRELGNEPKAFIESPKLNTKKLIANGLLNLVSDKPIEHEVFRDALMEAHELRILQSSLFSWRTFMELLQEALDHGNLRKVKLLFGQPYSEVAEARAHTFGLKGEDQFEYINFEIKKAIGGITQLARDYNGKEKGNTGKKYKIKLRLYYPPTAVPIYQFRNEQGKNQMTMVGIYWNHKSSYKGTHFVVSGSSGPLIKSINKHFKTLWKDVDKDEIFNWRRHLGLKKTKVLLNGEDNDKLIQLFRDAYFLRPFAIYHKEKPKWIYFKCFYHNFKNEAREFLLQIAPDERIAKISRTKNDNTYYGVVVQLHSSYSIFLHTINQDSSSRIIFLNIPVGGTKLADKELRFAIYNNNDVDDGSPYSQLMVLHRISGEQEFEKQEFEFKQFVPFLKEKKIGISTELWNGVLEPYGKLNDDYMYHFNIREREMFYENLIGHLMTAQNEIYFLGLAPIHFPNTNWEMMNNYFHLHQELIRDKKITIHRILLEPKVHQQFIDSVKAIKMDPTIAHAYRLYVAEKPIPVLNDLILIDPEESDSQMAILAFVKVRKSGDISQPIRLEVIRKDSSIISSLHDTCLKYLDSPYLVRELESVEEIDAYLSAG